MELERKVKHRREGDEGLIETIQTLKCDICGREMGHEHVIITWPGDNRTDVCHNCTKALNEKLWEMRRELR